MSGRRIIKPIRWHRGGNQRGSWVQPDYEWRNQSSFYCKSGGPCLTAGIGRICERREKPRAVD